MTLEMVINQKFLNGLLSLAIICIFCASCFAQEEFNQNWHRFRGPDGNGVAPNGKPPIKWTADSAKWKIKIPGSGSSSPIVWEDKVFVLTAVKTDRVKEGGNEQADEQQDRGRGRGRGRRRGRAPTNYYDFFVICLNRADGQEIWKTKVNSAVPHESGHPDNTFASGSPITDGKHVWAYFGSYGLFCLDMEGKQVWERQLGKMQTRAGFGEGSSPGVYKDTLVVSWDHEGDSFIETMDALTGKTKWKKDRNERTTWSTPVFVEFDGVVQVITNGSPNVRSYNLADGELIWECGGQASNPIPTPLVTGDMVVCMTGYRGYAAVGIPLSAKGDITGSDQVKWIRKDIGPYVPTGVLYKGRIYSTKGRAGVLTSVDAETGETIIDETRITGIRSIYASVVAANDHIFITGRGGTTVVLKHGDEYQVVASNSLGEGVDATPAIVGNQIFIRGAEHLYCFENKSE